MSASGKAESLGTPEGKLSIFSIVKAKACERDSSFMFWLIVILVLWSPWVLACAPGSNSTDMLAQLSQFLGHRPYSNHHPVFMSVVFGSAYSIGMLVGGNQGGHIAVLVFQTLCMASFVALAARWMMRAGVGRCVVWPITLFIGVVPVFPMFVQWAVKNTLAAGVMYLFVVQVLLLVLSSERDERPPLVASWWALAITGVLSCLMRNDGVLIVVPTLLVVTVVLWRKPENRRAASAGAGSVLAFYLAWMLVVIPGLGIQASNPREMLSLPVQQLAYTIKHDQGYFKGDLADDIDALLIDGRSVKTLGERYKTKVSDPVKKQFKFESRDEIACFLRIWIQVGRDHLGEYAKAAMVHTRGYWNPFMEKSRYCEVNNIGKLYTVAAKGTEHEDRFEGTFAVFPRAKALCRKVINAMWKVPGASLLGNPAFYAWVCLFAGVVLLFRRDKMAVLLVPAICVWGICCLSPLCGSLRYALPLCFIAPLLVGCSFIRSST